VDVIAFSTAEEFLEEAAEMDSGVLVTELRLPGIGGLELLQSLQHLNSLTPVIVLTGWADVATTVQAMQFGAFTLVEKPCSDLKIWEEIRRAFVAETQIQQLRKRKRTLKAQFEQLTMPEREVLEFLTRGVANKEIAMQLDVSVRTVESRRRSILNKMSANNVATLVSLVREYEAPVCLCAIHKKSRLA